MGKTITPKYRVEYRDQGGWHKECWRGRADGKRLEAWRVSRNASYQLGGVNWNVSTSLGYVPHISRAMIVRQSDACVIADVKMPMFEIS